jgi:acetyltransferase
MPKNLKNFFLPKSIALIGPSEEKGKVGAIIYQNILNSYKGNIYPVNNSIKSIFGQKCYSKISELPEIPDLVLVAVPAKISNNVLEEAIKFGVKNVVFYASGFKEIGISGNENEMKLVEILGNSETNLLGPNCFGFINFKNNLNATFGETPKYRGKIKFVSQSGAITSSIIDYANQKGFGFEEFITLGNKSNIDESDVLEYFLENSENEEFAIGMYLESIVDGKRFLNICSKLSPKHPLFILKPGKSEAGNNAIKSHTGSIAGEDLVFDVAMKDSGIIRCQTLEELFFLSNYFSWNQKTNFNNLLSVITNAGGPGVIVSDIVEMNKLKYEDFDNSTAQKIKDALPTNSTNRNPLDVIGDANAERYEKIGKEIINSKSDHILFILTPQLATEVEKTAEKIVEIKKQTYKNILVSFVGGEKIKDARKIFQENQILEFDFPEKSIRFLNLLQSSNEIKPPNQIVDGITSIAGASFQIEQILETCSKEKLPNLGNLEASNIISLLGLQTPKSFYYEEDKQIPKINFPVILKISANNLLHKDNIGGIIQNIGNTESLLQNTKKLVEIAQKLDKKIFQNIHIQVQEQVKPGIEVILGIKEDLVFGKILLFGLGGSLAEIVNDKNLAIFPITKQKIENLVFESLVGKLILKDKKPQFNTFENLVQEVEKFVQIEKYFNIISEVEINPLIINSDGIWAVDPKIILKK